MLPIWSFATSLIKPVTDLIDDLNTSDEEKMLLQAQLLRIQAEASAKLQEYEMSLLEARSNIIVAEAKGDSWLQASWRPITMLTFLTLVVFDSLALLPNKLAPEAWLLLQIGLGGYVVGRSLEKKAILGINETKKQINSYLKN